MKKILYSAVGVFAATAMAPAANAASFLLTLNAPALTIGSSNAFQADLAAIGAGLTHIGRGGVQLSEAAKITFEFMGTESGYHDTFETSFTAGGVSFEETVITTINHFFSGDNNPFLIGSSIFAGGTNLPLQFSNNVTGITMTPGDDGFGTLLTFAPTYDPLNPATLDLGSVVYFAYDDELVNPDDNHDDLIIRATLSPVPEPATWAFMLVGFGAVGYALRRRPAYKMAQAV